MLSMAFPGFCGVSVPLYADPKIEHSFIIFANCEDVKPKRESSVRLTEYLKMVCG